MLGAIDFQIQFLGKADTVQFAANLTTFTQPLLDVYKRQVITCS